MAVKEKIKRSPEQHWQSCVEVWFEFNRAKFPGRGNPSFDGPDSRNLRLLVKIIRERAEKAGVEWTEVEAKKRVGAFLTYAFTDKWLSEHFLLSNLVRQKDRIFFGTLTQSNNGNNQQRSFGKKPDTQIKSEADFGDL